MLPGKPANRSVMNTGTENQDATPDAFPAGYADDNRQIERALQLAIVQIDMTLRESGQSVEQMIGAITSLSGVLHRIRSELHVHIPESASVSDCAEASEQIRQATMASQFYDRMSQRLSHVMENLAEIVNVVSAPDGEHAALWENLQKRMRQVYSLEQEQAIHTALQRGLPADKINSDKDAGRERATAGDIELF